MSAIELARVALGSAAEHRRAPWRSRERWFEQRQALQKRLVGDATVVLEDYWARLRNPHVSRPWVLLECAAAEVTTPDDTRRLRSVAPMCLLSAIAGSPPTVPRPRVDRVGDAHVHAGGAVPFEDVLDFLLGSPPHALEHAQPAQVPRGLDVVGDPFHIGPAIVGMRLAVEHLSSSGRLQAPKGWSPERVFTACREFRRSRFHELVARLEPPGTRGDVTWGEIAAIVASHYGCRKILEFLVEAACLVHVTLTTADVASLDLFVDDFERYPSGPSTFVAATGWLCPEVDRLELRKTFRPVSGAAVATASVLAKVREFLAAASAHPTVALQMPLGFLKRVSPDRADPLELGGQLRLAEGFAEAFVSLPPAVRRIVASVDVAGNERVQSNIASINAINLFMRRVASVVDDDVTLSAHAGEAYDDPLSGLRAIGEFLRFVPGIRRLGHGLALDAARAEAVYVERRAPHARAGVALFDLCWSRLCLGPNRPPWRRGFDRLIEALARLVFPKAGALSADFLVGWYRSLFCLDTMLAHAERPFGDPVPGGPRPPADVGARMRDALVYPLADRGFHVSTVWAGGQLAAFVASARRTLYPHVRQHVVEQMSRPTAGVALELCPTSNCRLGRYTIPQHPVGQFLADGLTCTISTDDPALFSTTLHDELEALRWCVGLKLQQKLVVDSITNTAAALEDPGQWDYDALAAACP